MAGFKVITEVSLGTDKNTSCRGPFEAPIYQPLQRNIALLLRLFPKRRIEKACRLPVRLRQPMVANYVRAEVYDVFVMKCEINTPCHVFSESNT